MAHLDRAFRDLLDAFLDRSGTSGRRFGVEALGDPGFVASLRRGRRLGLRTADRLLAFTQRHTIPRRLDDPERWLFWTVDEAAALMGPALLGLAANQFVPGLIAGVGGWLLLRRVKRGGGANIARYALYWFLPDFVLRLKATPPSHLRRYAG